MFSLIIRKSVAAAMAAIGSAGLFAIMDANPSLYLYNAVVSPKKTQQQWNDKNVWITGASSGIGKELALQLASCGANLILSARSADKLQDVATLCRLFMPEKGRNVWMLPMDVTCSQEDMDNAVDQALELCDGGLDCVVLNAGCGHLSPATETSRDISMKMMQTNALGPMFMAQSILKKTDWKQSGRGRFVVVSSVAGKFAVPLSSSYTASKFALNGYFETLQSECPSLRIHMVCPGPIATPFHSSALDDSDQSAHASTKLQMPVKRCVQLLLIDMTRGRGGEVWIAQQPTLFFCYLSQFTPTLAKFMLKKIGPIRIAAWEQGLDLYDPATFRKVKISPSTKKAVQQHPTQTK